MKLFTARVFIFAIILGFGTLSSSGQSVDRQVIGAFGGSTIHAAGNLHSSVGEVVVGSYSDGNFYINQGFIQADSWQFVSVEEDANTDEAISIYPNPAVDQLTVEITKNGSGFRLTVFDYAGKLVQDSQFLGLRQTLNISQWSSGLYFVVLTNKEGKVHRTKFSKL